MKNRGVRFLLVLVAMAAALYYLKIGSRTDRQDFHIENMDDILSIEIEDKQPSNVFVERQADGTWMVNKTYEARTAAIDILLETLRRMRVKSPVSKSLEPAVFKRLASLGKKVSIIMQDGSEKVIYVGTETPNHVGTYMMIGGASKPYVMHIPGFTGFLSTRFFTRDFDWKSHLIVAWDNLDIKQVKITYPNSIENSFDLKVNEDGDIIIKGGSGVAIDALDSLSAQMYLANYRNVNFEGLVSDGDNVDQVAILAQTPAFVMDLESFDGEKVNLVGYLRPNYKGTEDEKGRVYEYDPERLFAVLNNDEFILLQYYTFDKLLVKKSHFIVNN